jgi:release factor glutamine methyltransferase
MADLTLVSAWTAARKRLGAISGLDTPTFEARLFVEAATGASRLDILTDPHRPVPDAAAAALEDMLTRREAREPAAHILGYKDFWTLRLGVSSAALTPRPETELLVTTALQLMAAGARVLDLGAGSGAVLLALLAERADAHGVGLDKSAEALALARANADALGLAARVVWVEGDWAEGDWAEADWAEGDWARAPSVDARDALDTPDALHGPFDVIVSNPPYVRSGAISLLEPEVARYEPHLALDGGRDGLDAYRAIFPLMVRLLRTGGPETSPGAWAVEIGQGQAEAVWALADEAGLAPEGVRDDLAGIPRVVFGHARGANRG